MNADATRRGRMLADVAFILAVLLASVIFTICDWLVTPHG